MKIIDLKTMKDGWYVGAFNPTAFYTNAFEINYRVHKAGEYWHPHTHTIVTEINLLIEGRMRICGEEVNTGQIFIIKPGEIAAPIFIEDCKIICTKIPSANDKVLLK